MPHVYRMFFGESGGFADRPTTDIQLTYIVTLFYSAVLRIILLCVSAYSGFMHCGLAVR